MKPANRIAAIALVLLAALACGEEPPPARIPLTVLASPSLEEFATEAAEEFERVANVEIDVRSAPTHELEAELAASPSADLFLATGLEAMDRLEEQGRIVPGSRWERVGNQMVLLGREEASYAAVRAVEIGRLGFRRFLVPDPERDPVGHHARRWLQTVSVRGESVWQQVAGRREVVGSVDEVLEAIAADHHAVGVVLASDLGRVPTGKVLFRSPDLGIRYSFALVERPGRPEEARAFLEFLQGPEGIDQLQVNGFLVEP
jgi:molybdate transport system substrate-binding protein